MRPPLRLMNFIKAHCPHSPLMKKVKFDPVAARNMTVEEIHEKFPRLDEVCPDCGEKVIVYASAEHYIAGDW